MRVKFNPDTKLYFLIGDPMGHSCTALVNNKMFEIVNQNALCIQATVKRGELPKFIEAAKLLGVSGIYLTTPHKEDIIQYLDECDELSRQFHSVNHIKIIDGKLIGIGLDGLGMGISIEKATGSLKDKKVLMIGAGAVAGPIAADLYRRGVRDFVIANRTVEKASELSRRLKEYFGDVKTNYGPLNDEFLIPAVMDRDAAIQCTSLGINSPGEADFDSLDFVDHLPKHCIAADVIYPTSSFLMRAENNDLKTVNGLWMALNQQKDLMKFHFGAEVFDRDLLEAEEAFKIALTIRKLREERLVQAQ